MFGNDNQGITFIDADQGEYNKSKLSAGAYISEPIFNEEMKIIGRNRMIYVGELSKWDSLREIYDSDINLSHLIHELGYAWAAEKDEYLQKEDGYFSKATDLKREAKNVVKTETKTNCAIEELKT